MTASDVLSTMRRSADEQMRAGMVLLLPRLRRFARALTGSWHQADDLVQDTVVRAIASWNDATRLIHAEGWMFRIMRNAWIDTQRARRVRLDHADAVRMRPPDDSNGEDAAVARLTLGAVDDALQSLPEDQRTVLLLVCVEELSYAQAATVLDIRVGTVMSRLARARSTLRRLLDEPAAASRQQIEPAIGPAP
jgi:RNA polymerase sigma-70 factor (ECF subfamily)